MNSLSPLATGNYLGKDLYDLMIYLIDFENVHEDGFHAIGHLGDKDAVYCFFTKNVAKISMSALAGMRNGQLHFVEADSGKQSLDLALVSFLGYLIGTKPQELCYDIISNDNGFQKAADFWNKRGMNLRVRVRKTNPENKSRAELAKAQSAAQTDQTTVQTQESTQPQEMNAQPAAQGQTRGRNRGPGRQGKNRSNRPTPVTPVRVRPAEEQPEQNDLPTVHAEAEASQEKVKAVAAEAVTEATASDDKPVSLTVVGEQSPSAEESTAAEKVKTEDGKETVRPAKVSDDRIEVDSMSVSGLESAGIPADAAEFLLAQAEKYREEKNIRQMVYRAVVKKYGQKKGTQIYNTAKKIVLR
ncbi:MAG: hypothetical protein K6C08_12320 [Oscillospiraceae bacterium]|nr:hypothetical protein [Oscillospiraceae bacterium]